MRRFFQPENPVMRLLSKAFDLMLLNFLFLISCIPVITAGAAISALYYMVLKMHRDEETYIVKGYFNAFKNNFRQATLIWIFLLFFFIFFGVDLYIIYAVIDPVYRWLQVPVWIIIFILLSVLIYAFPLLSSYESSTKLLLKNSVLLSLGNFPTTVFIAVIQMVLIRFSTSSARSFILTGSVALFIGCALLAYFYGLFFQRIFSRCMENQPEDKASEGKK